MNITRAIAIRYNEFRFKFLNLATIEDLPTDRFNKLTETLIESGWVKTFEYDGFDAWIDYGQIELKKQKLSLNLEWDNWTEGSIEGPRRVIEEIGKANSLNVIYQWRWR